MTISTAATATINSMVGAATTGSMAAPATIFFLGAQRP
jgi:hypothetical protein